MTAQGVTFSGSVPELYQQYLVPLLFEDYAKDIAARVRVPADGAVLETACGTGVVTRQLRQTLPKGARLVATDLSPAMLEVAKKQLKDMPGIEYQPADAVALPFPDASFDAVVCQYGVMFFPDKEQGYREAARVLKPGGSFIFNVWDSVANNPIVECVSDAAAALTPDNPSSFLRKIPYGYYDTDGIQAELARNGFAKLEVQALKQTSRAPSTHAAALALTRGTPLAAQLAERGIADAAQDTAEQALRKRFGSGTISAPMQAFVFVARKAG